VAKECSSSSIWREARRIAMTASRAIRLFVLLSMLAVLGCAALGSGSALAAKGGVKGTNVTSAAPSITLNEADPHFGDIVTFTVTYPEMRYTPIVRVLCRQDGEIVHQYAQWNDGGSPWLPSFALWDSIWAANGGGPADCVADLYYYTWKGQTETGIVYLAHTEFVAAG
jgi:hypothetical protein